MIEQLQSTIKLLNTAIEALYNLLRGLTEWGEADLSLYQDITQLTLIRLKLEAELYHEMGKRIPLKWQKIMDFPHNR